MLQDGRRLRDRNALLQRRIGMPFAIGSAAAAWSLYFALAVLRCAVFGFPKPWQLIQLHFLTAVVAVGLASLIYICLRRLDQARFRTRMVAALAYAIPAAALLSVINYQVMFVFAPPDFVTLIAGDWDLHPSLLGEIVQTVVENYFVFAAWAVLYIAVSNALQTQELLGRMALTEASARTAELRALRYQLDPHFLFNTLNTISSLMLEGEVAAADRMIEKLAAYMRVTLSLDASADITLAEEIDLQCRYLEIEQIRFGDRLKVDVAVTGAAASALVPALMLQPIVENSVRHGVGCSASAVLVKLSAWTDQKTLHILAENNGADGPAANGHGVGLANVCARLALRFGNRASCNYGSRQPTGFATKVELPINRPGRGTYLVGDEV